MKRLLVLMGVLPVLLFAQNPKSHYGITKFKGANKVLSISSIGTEYHIGMEVECYSMPKEVGMEWILSRYLSYKWTPKKLVNINDTLFSANYLGSGMQVSKRIIGNLFFKGNVKIIFGQKKWDNIRHEFEDYSDLDFPLLGEELSAGLMLISENKLGFNASFQVCHSYLKSTLVYNNLGVKFSVGIIIK